MKLISLGSSSKGNCHILYNGKSSIMLDCGVNMRNYNYKLQKYNIKCILLTHEHGDHCKGLKEKSYLGNEDVYSSKETLESLGNNVLNYRKKVVEELKVYDIDEDWQIVPIRVIHDVMNYGYIIKDKVSNLTIAYFTDLGYSDNLVISGVNVWIIECNHIKKEIEEKLEKALKEENSNVVYYKRVLSDEGHLCLEDSCRMISNNMGMNVKHIILCHISNSEKDYKRYEDLYLYELKTLETPLNGVKIHAINNNILDSEVYDIISKNKWEDIKLD